MATKKQLQVKIQQYKAQGLIPVDFNGKTKSELQYKIDEIELPKLTYGVEIEINFNRKGGESLSRTILAGILEEAGVPAVAGLSNRRPGHWTVVNDSSCGWEVVSPVLCGPDGFVQIEKVMDALRAAGCYTTLSCGQHVHIGAKDMEVGQIRRIVQSYDANEIFYDSIQPRKRRGDGTGKGRYCQSIRSTWTLSRLDECSETEELAYWQESRYSKVNLFSYRKHGTIEFRHHYATLRPQMTCAWIRHLLDLAVRCRYEMPDRRFDDIFRVDATHFEKCVFNECKTILEVR